MQFTFNEGHIQLPSQWQDQSMQVLVSTDNSGINLVITREAVPQGTLTPWARPSPSPSPVSTVRYCHCMA